MAIPPYYPDGGPGGNLISNADASVSFNSSTVSVQGYSSLSFVFVWSGFNQTDATVTIEVSNDGTNFDQKSGADATLGSTSGTQGISLNMVVTEAYYRVAFDHGTNSAGTISCVMVGK